MPVILNILVNICELWQLCFNFTTQASLWFCPSLQQKDESAAFTGCSHQMYLCTELFSRFAKCEDPFWCSCLTFHMKHFVYYTYIVFFMFEVAEQWEREASKSRPLYRGNRENPVCSLSFLSFTVTCNLQFLSRMHKNTVIQNILCRMSNFNI